jgi:glyoxylase-like metal-dependent hydrolase (beta-lactamase superfamily II)
MTNPATPILGFLAIASLGGLAAAQPQPTPLSVAQIKDGVYWVKGGSGANTGFIIGRKEVIVIDAKMTEASAQDMLAEIRKLTPNPVKYVVLTHSDGDHVNGLSAFPKGVTVVAHANSRKDMETAFKDPKFSALLPYLPSETLTAGLSLYIDGARVNLLHFGPAHTSGDLVVFLPDQKIAFVGDLVFLGRDPLVHREKGGNSFGLAETLKKILALDADTFVSGHNDPLAKAEIQGLLASIQEKQAKVKALVQQGKSLDEVKAALGVVDAPGPGGRRWPSFVEVVYLDLTQPQTAPLGTIRD